MQEYTLSDATRRALAAHHREFQAAIAVVANRACGIETSNPEGIGRYEGGVKVRGREITVKHDFVSGGWTRDGKTTAEEIAVANAIQTVAADFTKHGEAALEPYREMGQRMIMGDPLRAALGLAT